MKKILIACWAGCFLVNGIAYSQGPGSTTKITDLVPPEAASPAPVPIKVVNSKAAKNFTKDFSNASNVEWFENGSDILVTFHCNATKCRAYYSKKGNFEGIIRWYSEDQLPRDIRHMVKSTYYDFQIRNVTEVLAEPGKKLAYFLTLEGANSWITLAVSDGEMTVQQELAKKD